MMVLCSCVQLAHYWNCGVLLKNKENIHQIVPFANQCMIDVRGKAQRQTMTAYWAKPAGELRSPEQNNDIVLSSQGIVRRRVKQ